MVVIRLARSGKKGSPVYKVMVADKGAKLTGRFIEKLGTYTPGTEKDVLNVNFERYNHWVKLGAQASERLKKVVATHSAGAANA
ncbi:MAG: 30S ribosomal protein S16 [Bdellovibrionales bacterium]|nr:30S ribosomal protein S16 [Bdellovibrionales bacterium]